MRVVILALLLTITLCRSSEAGFIISVAANIPLQANTPNQAVDVFLESDNANDPDINGMNFQAYLGNSKSSVLAKEHGVFQGPAASNHPGVQMTGGGYFWDVAGSSVGGDGPVPTMESVAQVNANFNSGAHAVGQGNTVKIATLKIDTSGLTSGTYAISLSDPYDVTFSPTQLIAVGGVEINEGAGLTLSNGSFSIAAVPEPATLGIVGLALAGAAAGVRRRFCKRDECPSAG